jgi:dTDP-glucose pyrophosphorylase
MINIVIPMAGKTTFDDPRYIYPKPLIEINGKPLIQMVIESLKKIHKDLKFTFIINSSDASKYFVDNVIRLAVGSECNIIKLDKQTQGAAASVLMAIEHIDNEDELIVTNYDQLINSDISSFINSARKQNVDSFVLCFESIHPRWSFVRLDKDENIVETSEKRPISNKAIAGFYYFKKGKEFVLGVMEMIKKEAHVNGAYFTAPVLNELVLQNKKIKQFPINKDDYHSFYSPSLIDKYIQKVKNGN